MADIKVDSGGVFEKAVSFKSPCPGAGMQAFVVDGGDKVLDCEQSELANLDTVENVAHVLRTLILQDIKRSYNDRPYLSAEKLVVHDAKAGLKDLEFLSTFLDLDLSDTSSHICINRTVQQFSAFQNKLLILQTSIG